MKADTTERILSLSALVTAITAVSLGIVESRRNDAHRRLSVEPYLQIVNTNANGDYRRLIVNTGLGPARIESVSVAVDGAQVFGWWEVVQKLASAKSPKRTDITYGTVWKGQQIQAGETYAMLHLPKGDVAEDFHANVDELFESVCYCSIYRDCWVLEGSAPSPRAVDECPTITPLAFGG
jgi:hypothetical protein